MAILGKERTKEMEAIYEGVNRLLNLHMGDPKSRAFNAMLMGGKVAAEAMFQAARCYLWADQKDKAVETYLLLQRQYPLSTLKTKASRAVAQIQ